MPFQKAHNAPEFQRDVRCDLTQELSASIDRVIDELSQTGFKISRPVLFRKGIELAIAYYNDVAKRILSA